MDGQLQFSGSSLFQGRSLSVLTEVASGSYFIRMRSVGLKVLKNKLSEYVRTASQGETVLICDRDRVVAELVPPRETRSPLVADALLAEAIREGFITPAILPPSPPPQTKAVARLRELLAELEEDRAER